MSDWLRRYDLIWSSRLGRFEQSTVTSSIQYGFAISSKLALETTLSLVRTRLFFFGVSLEIRGTGDWNQT